jgi:tetratricopeptide (TPR) repeat protein
MNIPRREGLIALALFLATLACYAQVVGNGFVNFDDNLYVSDNRQVQAGLSVGSVVWSWTTFHAGYYQPLTWLSLQLDAQLFGTAAWGYHLSNLLWHAANVVLLFALLRRLTGAVWRSAAVAALFAVHPLHVESVAWVTERKDVLSTFWALVTLLAYHRYAERPSLSRYLAVLVAFALGLMAKPMLVTLPCVLLLLDWWPLRRWQGEAGPRASSWRLLGEKLPLFALAALFSAVTVLAQNQAGALVPLQRIPLAVRVAHAPVACVWYLGKTFWPAGLAPFYPHPGPDLTAWQVGGATLLLLAITGAALAARRPYCLVGWLWFLGMLVPVLGLVQAGEQPWADRFVYLPHVGLFLALVWGAADLLAAWSVPPVVRATLAAAVLIALAIQTWLQVGLWHDSVTLLEHALQVAGPNPVAEETLGGALLKAGQPAAAVRHLREAVRLGPNRPRPHYNLGLGLATLGEREEAARHYREALRLDPGFALAHYNLGVVLIGLGRREPAIEQFEAAIRHDPALAPAHFNLAAARGEQGDRGSAIRHFQQVLDLEPDFKPSPRYRVGLLLIEAGQFEEAVDSLKAVLSQEPDNASFHYQLGRARAAQGRWVDAERYFVKTIRLQPGAVRGYSSLGRVLDKQGRHQEAQQQYQQALRLNPTWPQTTGQRAWLLATHPQRRRRNGLLAVELAEAACAATGQRDARLLDVLASAYAEMGRFEQAQATARQALALAGTHQQLHQEIAARLKLFQDRRPFRTPSASPR